ncbi:hypothetical protein AB8U03_04365 [Clostridium sp. Mt-5]|uniref:Uncharacterized protein n=1 Tax=Clostridium moutaii TaxID=3240932 RepID=A0ABV4BKX0_9CLOT
MHKKIFLEVNNKNIMYREISNKNSIFDLFNNNKINKSVISIKDIKVKLKNRNLIILVHGEEIYIVFMELPKMNRENLFRIIKEELENKFKKMDNIMFSYEIIRRYKYRLEIMVFCMNWHNMKVAEKCDDVGFRIKGIVPIQFYIWENYKDKIINENYIFILMRDKIIYFIACHRGKIVFNNVFKNISKDGFFDILEQFRVKLSILMPDLRFSHIFFVDFPYKDIIEKLSENYMCKDLAKFIMK